MRFSPILIALLMATLSFSGCGEWNEQSSGTVTHPSDGATLSQPNQANQHNIASSNTTSETPQSDSIVSPTTLTPRELSENPAPRRGSGETDSQGGPNPPDSSAVPINGAPSDNDLSDEDAQTDDETAYETSESMPIGNTNINLGGAQDFGYFRRLIAQGLVPESDAFEAAGFFAEHHTPLPTPDCGDNICLQGMLGVMANLTNGNNCTLLQIGLNSPLMADPSQRPPLNLVVVVDVSGSMAASGKLEFVLQGLRQMVNELNDDDQVALVKYSRNADVVIPMTMLQGNRNEIQNLVASLVPEGATNIFAGLELGYQQAMSHYDSARQNRVILLSDGEPTAGTTRPGDILELSRTYNSEGVGLTSIGLGTDFNYDLMRDLAIQGDGNFYFVEDAPAVQEVFTEELTYFTVPVAFDLQVTMSPTSRYRIVRAYGSDLWETTADGNGQITIPSVFLAHRESHADVGQNGTRRGGGSALLIELMPVIGVGEDSTPRPATVADLTLQFKEPGSDEVKRQELEVVYPEGPGITLLRGFFDNQIVEKSFVMLNIFVGLATAVDLFHLERDREGALGLLIRLNAAVRDYEDDANGGEGDVDMQYNIELIEALIDVMAENGATVPVELEVPEDPWPAD